MAKVELIAKRAGHYPKKVAVGERFKVDRTTARTLIAVGIAELAPPPTPVVVVPHPGPPLPRRAYLRRDMKAEN